MVDVSKELDDAAEELRKLRHEIIVVLRHTKKLWGTENDFGNGHFPYTSYGLMMCVMSKVDYLSKHWIQQEPNDQTKRIVEFMHVYLGYPKSASEIAVQFFRHNLMHTSSLDEIMDNDGNKYRWLLHHGDGSDLSKNQHMKLKDGKLDAGVLYFIDDLIAAIPKMSESVKQDSFIGASWEAVEKEMRSFRRKI